MRVSDARQSVAGMVVGGENGCVRIGAPHALSGVADPAYRAFRYCVSRSIRSANDRNSIRVR
jgi:hypothetical protein